MTTSPRSPRLLKGGLVLLDPGTSAVLRVVPLQYNPDGLSRSLEVRGAQGGDRSEALRLTGPPRETIKLDAELDAADAMAGAEPGDEPEALSLHAQLAALETIVYPSSSQLQEHKALARSGALEIAPAEAPLTVFVWGAKRVLPVRIETFSIVEESFDPELNPLRAKISLGMTVLSATDLGLDHPGAGLFSTHHQTKEQLAGLLRNSDLESTLGVRL